MSTPFFRQLKSHASAGRIAPACDAISEARALFSRRDRKDDTRRKILARIDNHQSEHAILEAWLDTHVTREDDLALFNREPKAALLGNNRGPNEGASAAQAVAFSIERISLLGERTKPMPYPTTRTHHLVAAVIIGLCANPVWSDSDDKCPSGTPDSHINSVRMRLAESYGGATQGPFWGKFWMTNFRKVPIHLGAIKTDEGWQIPSKARSIETRQASLHLWTRAYEDVQSVPGKLREVTVEPGESFKVSMPLLFYGARLPFEYRVVLPRGQECFRPEVFYAVFKDAQIRGFKTMATIFD